jgi:hypothetical protein
MSLAQTRIWGANVRKLISRGGKRLAAFALSVGMSGAFVGLLGATPAQADSGIDMNLACQYTYSNTVYKGQLTYPSQGAYGWRCINRSTGVNVGGVNVYGYCVNVLGGYNTYNVPSNPYSWVCLGAP